MTQERKAAVLAETYGVSRSKMKTKEEILAIAKEIGVELEGLE